MRPVRTGLVLSLAAAISISTGSIAAADKTPPVIPTRAQVAAANDATVAKQRSLADIQQELVQANAQVLRAAHEAEVAAEEYNGAKWRLSQAQEELRVAAVELDQARADVAQQRTAIAILVADSYQRGADLSTATVLLSKGGPEGVVQKASVARAANDSMQVRFDAFRAAQELADAAKRKAAAAEADQEALLRQASTTRTVAAAAADRAQAYVAALTSQKQTLAEDLAQAQNISVSLAKQRQDGLEQQAAAQAAAAEQAREQQSTGSSTPQSSSAGQSSPEPDSPAPTPEVSADPPPTGSGVSAAIAYARSKLGMPYRWGAAGPSAFDCSGLTMMAWRAGGKSLPHYSAAQYSTSTPISRAALKPGDLVFWGSSPGRIHHVALYLGGGQILHAPRTGQPVRVDSIDYWIPPTYFARP
ncbi:MAG TPA: NlpC/P60 family protein [Marmoricola sp.]|nr:NlpC/P60 family protein [Marmoricola sp.]